MDDFEDELKEQYTGRIDIKGALSGSFPGEKSLLEELSIDLNMIKTESLLPLKVLKHNTTEVNVSSDVTGPIIILVVFTLSLVIQGKLHFGYIYLISLTSSFLMFILLNLLTSKGVDYSICCNIMGYSMTPIVAFSLGSMVLVWTGMFIKSILGIGMSAWSAYTASKVVCTHLSLVEKMVVVGYPLFLAYMCFMMMVLF
ncbi:uncharacterized protein VICG_01856 [Vittaforma corneae ATCC 50505]|uniref:Protein YIP n=1 Tax=Vittaforma corneae (strain ATCC 50505) TaxID=993615 RepID=L2GJL5_VITCO|nr:uncharacterized protein VICG_01856 [Vittaforma corneae ATCC 50505]ELA41063.1 hypothetical protein VICG_01856 [Vittaforma corneae ATCC 50505]